MPCPGCGHPRTDLASPQHWCDWEERADSRPAAGGVCWEAAAFSAVENPIKHLLNSFVFFFPSLTRFQSLRLEFSYRSL